MSVSGDSVELPDPTICMGVNIRKLIASYLGSAVPES